MTCFCLPSLSKAALPAVAALGMIAIAPAADASSQENLRNCKAQLVLDGIVTESTERVSLEKAKRRTITLNVKDSNGSEREVMCRISKGEVTAVEVDGELYVAKPVETAAGN